MAEDVFDIEETNISEFESKIGQIERVFDVEVTVTGLAQDGKEEFQTSCEKGKTKSTVRISSPSGNTQSVTEAKVGNFTVILLSLILVNRVICPLVNSLKFVKVSLNFRVIQLELYSQQR